jgi:hypothetical protein
MNTTTILTQGEGHISVIQKGNLLINNQRPLFMYWAIIRSSDLLASQFDNIDYPSNPLKVCLGSKIADPHLVPERPTTVRC